MSHVIGEHDVIFTSAVVHVTVFGGVLHVYVGRRGAPVRRLYG